MDRVDMLRRRLEEAFSSSPYHGFIGSISGVSDEESRWVPPRYKGFRHMDGSILNLAFHTGGDKHVLMSHAFGDGSLTWEVISANFREEGGDLAAARRSAEDGHALVIETLTRAGEGGLDLPRPYYGGKQMTAYEIFTIVAEHDIYHAGQIRYIRNLLAGGAAG